ncbi:MAG: glycosyltransferase [Planctomycetota bacterium]
MAERLLIASFSAGAGHVRAAEALKHAFEQAGHDGVAESVDTLRYLPRLARGPGLRAYYALVDRLQFAWRLIYDRANQRPADGPARRLNCLAERTLGRRFLRDIRDDPPNHIVCTHFAPAGPLAWMRRTGRLDAPLAVTITDYDDHRMWINPGADHYFVAADYLRERLIGKGAPPDRVSAPGIPIDPVFSRPMTRDEARSELDLDADRPTVLAAGGGRGLGPLEATVDALARCGDLQILAVAGHNDAVRQKLDALDLPRAVRLVTYGYVDFMEKLMAAADLAVMKPGGMSSSECLAVGLPMVLTEPIPGQEEANFEFLVGCGAALPATDLAELQQTVTELLGDRERLRRMSAAARRAGRPHAAHDIIEAVLAMEPAR